MKERVGIAKFMLLQELFGLKMDGKMSEYLRSVKQKVSELAAIGTAIDDDVKLVIILNGLPEKYHYLVVPLNKKPKSILTNSLQG